MKGKLFFAIVIFAAVFMSSCGQDVNIQQDKDIINSIYQSLETTPEQFRINMAKIGLNEIPQYDFMANHYKTFATDSKRSVNTLIVNIYFNNDTILQVEYERCLNNEANISAFYRLFSDKIAALGYAEWQGFFVDTFADDTPTQTATDRNDLCGRINNEHLREVNSKQDFVEKFIYSNGGNSHWNGLIHLWCDNYFSKDATDEQKDIYLTFSLIRVE